MILEENMVLTRAELAEFFCIQPQTITRAKEKYLEELKEYCDYELSLTPKGNFRSVTVKKVYCDTYYRTYKKDFINWLNNNDVFALTGEDGFSNLAVITNYYCKENKIPYDGPHYVYVDFEGHTDDGKRKLKETKKVPNLEYRVWHYLYRLAGKYYEGSDDRVKDWVDMCAAEIHPSYVRIMTKEDKEKYNEIAFKIFGNQSGNFADAVIAIEEMDVQDMTSAELRC